MKHFETFESFHPKDIVGRKAEIKRIHAQKLAYYNTFVKNFQDKLNYLQGLKVDNVKEQTFINFLQNATITQTLHNDFLFSVEANDKIMLLFSGKIKYVK